MEIFDVNTVYGFYPYKKIDISQKKLLSIMKNNNITKACTLSLKGTLYDYEEGNEDTLIECSGITELIPIATLDPRKVDNIEGEVKKLVSKGYKIVRLFPDLQGWSVEQASAQKMVEILDFYNVPIIINEALSKVFHLPCRLNIPIIFLSNHYYKLHDTIAVFKYRENFYAETRQLISPDAIEYFSEKIGANRLIFGSNSPLEYIKSSINRVIYSNITEKEKELIFSLNLKRIINY